MLEIYFIKTNRVRESCELKKYTFHELMLELFDRNWLEVYLIMSSDNIEMLRK